MNTKHLNIWVPIHFSSHSNFLLYTEKCEQIAAIAIIFFGIHYEIMSTKKVSRRSHKRITTSFIAVFVECMVSAEKT